MGRHRVRGLHPPSGARRRDAFPRAVPAPRRASSIVSPCSKDIETPALLLDADKLDRNCARMRDRVRRQGRDAASAREDREERRGHADRAGRAASGAITVSTLREADVVLRPRLPRHPLCGGHRAFEGAARRGARAARREGERDRRQRRGGAGAGEGAQCGRAHPTLVEIDSDGHRAGNPPGDPRLLEVADALGPTLARPHDARGRFVQLRRTEVHSRGGRARARRDGERRDDAALRAGTRARGERGLDADRDLRRLLRRRDRSAHRRLHLPRPRDGGPRRLRHRRHRDLGARIGDRPPARQELDHHRRGLDGDVARPRHAKQKVDQGYGVVCDASGRPIDDLIVIDANQEHGIVARRDGGPSNLRNTRSDRCCACCPTTRAPRRRNIRNIASLEAESPWRRGSASAAGESGTLGI